MQKLLGAETAHFSALQILQEGRAARFGVLQKLHGAVAGCGTMLHGRKWPPKVAEPCCNFCKCFCNLQWGLQKLFGGFATLHWTFQKLFGGCATCDGHFKICLGLLLPCFGRCTACKTVLQPRIGRCTSCTALRRMFSTCFRCRLRRKRLPTSRRKSAPATKCATLHRKTSNI